MKNMLVRKALFYAVERLCSRSLHSVIIFIYTKKENPSCLIEAYQKAIKTSINQTNRILKPTSLEQKSIKI